MKATLSNAFHQMKRYPSAVVGSIIILLLIFMAIYAMIAIPYGEAVRLYGVRTMSVQTPRNARPAWLNYFYQRSNPSQRMTTEDIPT